MGAFYLRSGMTRENTSFFYKAVEATLQTYTVGFLGEHRSLNIIVKDSAWWAVIDHIKLEGFAANSAY